ncbi:hypothetical protein K458DRAFT_153790 [Lentithecium fluviatile CBS 122367]|uniref:Uncharacterized protein n=1 Tax=Lentithecium fluviatile CBS 122367 TaxID=1168545 RepID=A0A6G1JF25_9PLEO|nr:hypothetical protein K458DRAFT_153790 [Lentithecium fluviatile CBS 122367]
MGHFVTIVAAGIRTCAQNEKRACIIFCHFFLRCEMCQCSLQNTVVMREMHGGVRPSAAMRIGAFCRCHVSGRLRRGSGVGVRSGPTRSCRSIRSSVRGGLGDARLPSVEARRRRERERACAWGSVSDAALGGVPVTTALSLI